MYTPSRLVLPLKSKQRIMPNTPTPVGAFATEAIDVERFFISAASSKGGAADWIVNDLVIGGRSQFRHKDLPGFLFSTGGIGGVPRSSSAINFDGLDVVGQGQELKVVVSYVGPNPEGADFIGSVVGTEPKTAPTILPIATARAVKPKQTVKITARLVTAAFRPERLMIEGAAHDWVVNDLRVNGRSQFSQAGDVPGDMFATNSIDGFVSMDTCLIGNPIEIVATYIGDKSEGERFVSTYEGTVAALDPAHPPELRALVNSSLGFDGRDEDAGELVVATTSARPRSRSEAAMLEHLKDQVAPVGVDLIEQCSELVMKRAIPNVDGAVVETRIVTAPDPDLGRKLCFFVATKDGKRAEIAAAGVDALLRLADGD